MARGLFVAEATKRDLKELHVTRQVLGGLPGGLHQHLQAGHGLALCWTACQTLWFRKGLH